MSTLTVALPSSPPTAASRWSYVLDAGDGRGAEQGEAPLGALPRATRLVLVVPAEHLSWHTVRLPPVAASRRRAALDGLLEDLLLDEPARLALALGPRPGPEGTQRVAACARDWLQAQLAAFEGAGRPASRVVPELAPVEPGAAPRLRVTGTPEDAWLLLADAAATVRLPLAEAAPLLAGLPEAAELAAEPAVAELAEHTLGRAARRQPKEQRLREAAAGDWQLAQFDLAISPLRRVLRRWHQRIDSLARAPRWRWTRWGLAAGLLVQFIGLQAWAWQLDERLADGRRQQRALLLQAFPKVRAVIDPALQLERELAVLRQANGALGGADLESMLGALGAALPAEAVPEAIEFGAGKLVLQGVALDAARRDRLGASLRGQGYVLQHDAARLTLQAGGG